MPRYLWSNIGWVVALWIQDYLHCTRPRAYISECALARMAEDCPPTAQEQGEVEGGEGAGEEGGGGAAIRDWFLVSFM